MWPEVEAVREQSLFWKLLAVPLHSMGRPVHDTVSQGIQGGLGGGSGVLAAALALEHRWGGMWSSSASASLLPASRPLPSSSSHSFILPLPPHPFLASSAHFLRTPPSDFSSPSSSLLSMPISLSPYAFLYSLSLLPSPFSPPPPGTGCFGSLLACCCHGNVLAGCCGLFLALSWLESNKRSRMKWPQPFFPLLSIAEQIPKP